MTCNTYFTFYLENRKGDLIPLVQSEQKAGFVGLLLTMESVEKIFDDVILTGGRMKYLLTYKLSQVSKGETVFPGLCNIKMGLISNYVISFLQVMTI